MSSQNDMNYVRHVFTSTADGIYALLVSLVYLLVGIALSFRLMNPPQGVGDARDIAGFLAMPILLLLVHLWHRSGVALEKRLHLPSIIGVSAFAFLVPLIRFGVL